MKNFVLLFGGRSAEHSVSVLSANSFIEAFSSTAYQIVPVYISVAGEWSTPAESISRLHPGNQPRVFAPDCESGILDWMKANCHVAFPLLHGTFGEDGTIQGLFDMLDVPYIGSGVTGSAVSMDKVLTKNVLEHNGIPCVPSVSFYQFEWNKSAEHITSDITRKLGYPVFVKPANAGSSIGISKVKNEEALPAAIQTALQFDQRILVEKGLNVREIEVSILGNIDAEVSVPGEILPGAEFYDYEDKYFSGKSNTQIPAQLSEETIRIISEYAKKATKVLNLEGMARIDFFIDRETGDLYLNEVNTIPGFTPISMYPKMWLASGYSYSSLIEKLIELALARFESRKKIASNFTKLVSR